MTTLALPPVRVCLLGRFHVLKHGAEVPLRADSKAEHLLGVLALGPGYGVAKETLLGRLWPDREFGLARQSLNTLVYSLHRLFGDALDGQAPVIHRADRYGLNAAAGVSVDVQDFEANAHDGDRSLAGGDTTGALAHYRQAADLYGGELAFGSDLEAYLARERLRARHLEVLQRLAEQSFAVGDLTACLAACGQALEHDPCREATHRLMMRCLVRLGRRAEALHQYRICCRALAMEFDARPERATEQLYELVRLDPDRV